MDNPNFIFNDPKKFAVLNRGIYQIPGSPWAKPASTPSSHPTHSLPIASVALTISFVVAVGWVLFLFIMAMSNYSMVGRVIIEMILAMLAFFGLFWNLYFTVPSIFKCFIPSKAFRTNTKYCSMIPEEKPAQADWLDCSIQVPVYKESLQEVLIPTLNTCVASHDYCQWTTGANCNIVICDNAIMALLKNNFAAAEMLWEMIKLTKGRFFELSQLLQKVPCLSRCHLKGLSSCSVYKVFHQMLFYYHYDIGFVARSTFDCRRKFKKASNLNSNQLSWRAGQLVDDGSISTCDT